MQRGVVTTTRISSKINNNDWDIQLIFAPELKSIPAFFFNQTTQSLITLNIVNAEADSLAVPGLMINILTSLLTTL